MVWDNCLLPYFSIHVSHHICRFYFSPWTMGRDQNELDGLVLPRLYKGYLPQESALKQGYVQLWYHYFLLTNGRATWRNDLHLEYMIHAYTFDFKASWEDYLLLAVFACSDDYQSNVYPLWSFVSSNLWFVILLASECVFLNFWEACSQWIESYLLHFMQSFEVLL